jgi:hypothetical protein
MLRSANPRVGDWPTVGWPPEGRIVMSPYLSGPLITIQLASAKSWHPLLMKCKFISCLRDCKCKSPAGDLL